MSLQKLLTSREFREFRSYVSFAPEQKDVAYIATHLREADKAETLATLGHLPGDLAEHLWANTTTHDGKTTIVYETPDKILPMLIYGVCEFPHAPGVGFVWAQGTAALQERRHTFLRLCGIGIAILQHSYKELRCYVDERNRLHRAWLSWVGFKPVRYHTDIGPLGLPFIEYRLPGGSMAARGTLNKRQRGRTTDV